MLLEITTEEMKQIVPIVPTREQYVAYWSNAEVNRSRILTAILISVSLLVVSRLFGENNFFGILLFLVGILTLLYPFLWGPLYTISRRNLAYREIPYTGLFFGRVLRLRRLTAVVEEREKVANDGDIYIEEIRERQFEMEIGDEDGVRYRVRVKDDPRYEAIVEQQSVLAMVKSSARDLARRPVVSEIYLVKLGEWVGDVSYLNRENFLELANDLLDEA